MFRKSRSVHFLEPRAPAGGPLTERSFGKLTQNKCIHLKEISKNDLFQKKIDFWWILQIKINILPKTKTVRMVHVSTFGRIDLGRFEIKEQFWKKTDSHPSSRELGSGKWFPGDPKYIKIEFYGSVWMPPPSHSIRLVKLVSKNPTRAKVNRKIDPKLQFDAETQQKN